MGYAHFHIVVVLLLSLLYIAYTAHGTGLTPQNHSLQDFIDQIWHDASNRPNKIYTLSGVPIPIASAKYQASVRLKSAELAFFRQDFICSGTVISQRVVLTAAHCIYDNSATPPKRRADHEFTVVMGTELLYTKSSATLQYDAQQIVVHEAFNVTSLANDIAMILLNGYIPWNWSTVQALPLNTQSVADDTQCSLTGWGVYYGKVSFQLNVATVPIVEWSRCKITRSLSEGSLCAGSYQKGAEKRCHNDSGGPLICNGLFTGVVSSGVGCDKQLYPGIYMNVSYYHDWISTTNSSFDYSNYGVFNLDDAIAF